MARECHCLDMIPRPLNLLSSEPPRPKVDISSARPVTGCLSKVRLEVVTDLTFHNAPPNQRREGRPHRRRSLRVPPDRPMARGWHPCLPCEQRHVQVPASQRVPLTTAPLEERRAQAGMGTQASRQPISWLHLPAAKPPPVTRPSKRVCWLVVDCTSPDSVSRPGAGFSGLVIALTRWGRVPVGSQ